jgi:DNA helicase-2/ATP-dependent DNA helicase PcrA
VEYVSGPLLVLAGPGSGKTRVITHRIAYLIQYCGVKPHNILAVTFTNKAASEMRERIEQLAPGQVSGLTMGTFHSICSRILRREGEAIGVDSNFVIYDESDQQTLVRRILKEFNLDDKMYRPSALLAQISNAKSELRGPHEYAEHAASYLEEIVARVYKRYQEMLAENRALDFDDLLMTTVRLFRESPETLQRYQERYEQILVDEFQDTNVAQYIIVKQLAAKHRNVCVVGDEDQSIYSWRKADIRNILNFEQDFPETK